MGALTSFASSLPVIQQGANAIFSGITNELSAQDQRAEQKLALQQLQAKQRLAEKHSAQDAALEKERLAENAAQAEQDRQRALRRAVARQKVNFASQGISPVSGSGQAVLLGLFDETDEERAERERMDGLRSRAIDQGLSQQRSINVLQREQLRKSQKIGSLSSNLGSAKNIISSVLGSRLSG